MLVARMAATLDAGHVPTGSDPLPILWHWAFFHEAVPISALGADGHPRRGGFLPPVDLPNRMWAGSDITVNRLLRVGERVVCDSMIEDIQFKQGRSGPLVFVTVRHDYKVENSTVMNEQQNIVYRGNSSSKGGKIKEPPASDWTKTIDPTPVLLFRYSAVTFNGHRIHYDYPYVTETEGYPGLLVHGPLIATLMCQAFSENNPGTFIRRFAFRGMRPLTAPHAFQVAGRIVEDGQAEVWAADGNGIASQGEIEFEQGND